MTQQISRAAAETLDGDQLDLATTRSPIRIDGHTLTSDRPAPRLGQHNATVRAEFFAEETV